MSAAGRGGEAAAMSSGGEAAPVSSGGAAAPVSSGGKHLRARRPRWVRGLLTLAGALAATLGLGTLTSTAGAQGFEPPACLTSAAAQLGAANTLSNWGPGGNFTNYVDNGADWVESGIDTKRGSGTTGIHSACVTTSLGRARVFNFPVRASSSDTRSGGQFVERIRFWTDSDKNDSYLRLYAADGTLIAEDDDSGEGYNAFISLRVDGLPDRFVGEGSSNIPGTPVTWRTVDGRGGGGTGNYEALWLEVGTYGPQADYDTSVTVTAEFDFGAPWGSDLAAGIVAQLGGLPPTGTSMAGFPTAEAAISKRDTGEAFVSARFFNFTHEVDHSKEGNRPLDRSNADLWFVKSPRSGVLYRRTSALQSGAPDSSENPAIRGSASNSNTTGFADAFTGGDTSRSGTYAPTDGTRSYGMVPVFRHDYDPALAATGDPRAMNDSGLDDDGDDICEEAGTERAVISLAALSGAVNQYTTCVPKRGVSIEPRGLSLDEGGFDAGDLTGTFRDDSDRLEPVGYLAVEFDEDNDFGVWPIVIDLNGAPHPVEGATLALAAGSGGGGTTLTVSGLQEGTDSVLHPDSDDDNEDWALQILIDDETAQMGTATCLNIPSSGVDNPSNWNDDVRALDAYLSTLRIPKSVTDVRRGTVQPLTEIQNSPQVLRVGEFWVREFDPWFTGSSGSKVINLNRSSSHARNEIYHQHPGLRAANELTATGFNFRSGRCYAVSIRYMEVHPGTGLPVGKGLKLRKEFVAP